MKNKEITIYELVKLVKNGKAPKKIFFENEIYIFNGNSYFNENETIYLSKTICLYNDLDILNLKVEILPEDDEWEDIEELFCDYVVPKTPATENEAYIMSCLLAHEQFINKLIKNQKYLKEKLENKDE